jgi:hypothetical protein
MFVSLPPLLTYRASRLIEGGSDAEYWNTVFEAEWIVLVLSRWCADIIQRRIMWRLPGQARAGVETMGLGKLLRDSPYGVDQLRRWLYDHDLHLWGAKFMSRMLRGPSRGEEELYENVEEFARTYTPSTEPLPKGPRFTLPGYRSPATNPPRPRLPAYDVDNEVAFEPDPHPKGTPPTTASVITDPLPTGSPPSSVALSTDHRPRDWSSKYRGHADGGPACISREHSGVSAKSHLWASGSHEPSQKVFSVSAGWRSALVRRPRLTKVCILFTCPVEVRPSR